MSVEEKLQEAVKLMRKDLLEKRELNYDEGSIGITSLIYCPLKAKFRKEHPDLRSEANAIDDGFIFENMIEPYITKVFKGKVLKDADIPYEVDGFRITGHPDFVIEQEDKIIILELKAPVFFFSSKTLNITESEFIIDTKKEIKISESYILQAKVQKFITEKFYNKPVESYLFLKTTLQESFRKMRKVFIVRKVEESITEKDMLKLINDFKTLQKPRYEWECKYCIYAKENICVKGMLFNKSKELER